MRLDQGEFARLRPQFQEVSLSFKQPVHEQGTNIQYAWFPESGVISLVKQLDDGNAVETSTVGNEGMVGLPALFGCPRAPLRAFCQVPGRALRLKADVIVAERRRGGPFAELLMRYAHATMAMLAQGLACNRAHALEERMCRWLLMTHDRVDADSFQLTQEFLAQMLGVRRPTVSVAGTALQRAGLIRYSRGRITVVNRKGLEEASCECYGTMRDEISRSLGRLPKEPKVKR
jgi:CRP-like cAMP-binding protein